jgi:diacylglycerol kinase
MFHNHHSLFRAFINAFHGIKYALRERSFFIQVIIGFFAIIFAFILNLSFAETAVVIILSILVLVSEILNTVIEKALDVVSKEQNPEVAKIKDLAAAGVLIFSISAFLIGLWIFGNAIFLK